MKFKGIVTAIIAVITAVGALALLWKKISSDKSSADSLYY